MSQLLTEGGTERQLSIIARELDRSRFLPIVGCFRPEGIRYEELVEAGIRVVSFPVRSWYNPPPFGPAIQLGRFLKREQIDLIHTFDVPANLLGIPVASFVRTPFILSSQRAHRTLTRGLLKHILRLTDRMVDGTVVNSKAVLQELVEDEKLSGSRLHLCYNALDTRNFYPPEERVESPINIGGIGVFRTEKGHRTLIEAFARVHRIEPHTRLQIVGGGPLHDELQRLVNELGIAGVTSIEPSTSAVRDKLQGMHIFVLPSFSEAQSNALLEAMACGCCTLATRVGGNMEIMSDNVTGELFEPGDVPGLSSRLLALVRDRDKREQYGEAACKRVRDQFSLQASVNRMQEIYERIMRVE